MKLYYATTNNGKVNSLKRDLDPYLIQVIQKKHLNIIEPRGDVEEVAKLKVIQAYDILLEPVVANDAGFYIHSLKGFPREQVTFALDTIELEGILRLVNVKRKECKFIECMAYLDDSLEDPKYFTSEIPGKIAHEPRGTTKGKDYLWSELALIFIPDGNEKTLAEMTEDEYHEWRKISTREKESSSRKFLNWFLSYKNID